MSICLTVATKDVLSADAQQKGSTKEQSQIVQTEKTEAGRLYGEYIRISRELSKINMELQAPEQIESKYKLMHPDKDFSDYFKELQERKKVLQKELKQILSRYPPPQHGDYELAEPRPFRVDEGAIRTQDANLQNLIKALRSRCPTLSFGQVQASGFRQYNWSHSEGGFGNTVFWPPSDYPIQIPSSTFMGDWTGETGSLFFGAITTRSNPGIDYHQHTAVAGVLQFTLPAPDCASVIYWGTTGRLSKEGPWMFSSDWGVIETQWVLRESPTGLDFPVHFEIASAFTFFADGLYGESDVPERSWKTYDSQDFNRSFRVRPGVEAKIYLGISLWLGSKGDGSVMTAILEKLSFDHGITFIMVPEPE